MAHITTICVVGFPPEAHPRELKNLCRFVPGFEGAHVAFAGAGQSSALFVKFQTNDFAQAAMDSLHGAPFDTDAPQVVLKAEWARREMEVRPNSLLPAPMVTSPPAWQQVPERAVARPAAPIGSGHLVGHQSRRVGATGGELTTVTVLGLGEKGLSVQEVKHWFQQRPGFVTLHMNERIDGLFVKFSTGRSAEQGIEDANAMQFGAEWARRNLDDDIASKSGAGAPLYQPPPLPVVPTAAAHYRPQPAPAGAPAHGGFAAAGKRPRTTAGELNTITILGIREKELSPDMLQQWFQERPGFVAMQVNERINAVFAKFNSQAAASKVLDEANALQFGAEWARRNLDI